MESEIQRLKNELEQVKSELVSIKNKSGRRLDDAFWSDIATRLTGNPESVKQMVRDGTIKVTDTDRCGRTLMFFAAWKGAIDVAQLCINLGADVNNPNDETLKTAIGNNYDHVEQLVLLAQAKSGSGDRIKNMSQEILKQNAIIENILNELSSIGQQSKDLYIKILKEIMINILKKKLVFSDDLLSLCWKIETENGNESKSELWITIKTVCQDIIKGHSKRDWYWLKQCLLPSNVKYNVYIYIYIGYCHVLLLM